MGMHTHVCTHFICLCRDQMPMLDLSVMLSILVFEIGSLTERGPHCLGCLAADTCHHGQLYMGAGHLNSGLHACAGNILPSELFPKDVVD